MENSMVEKMKEDIRLFMETEIQPILKYNESIDVIKNEFTRNNLIEFHYNLINQNKNNYIYFTFQILKNEQNFHISIDLRYNYTNISVINREAELEEIFSFLKKEVKKYAFSKLYDK